LLVLLNGLRLPAALRERPRTAARGNPVDAAAGGEKFMSSHVKNVRSAFGGALSAFITLGVCAGASAQTTTPTDPRSDAPRPRRATQEQFDREKVTLKDRLQGQIDSATRNIDVLKKMSQGEKGNSKKEHTDMGEHLSDMRSRLQGNIGKIDRATLDDWGMIRPTIKHDMTAMKHELQRVAAVTDVPVPTSGAANTRPRR